MTGELIFFLLKEVGLPAARQVIAGWKDEAITPEKWLELLPKVRPYDDYIKEAEDKLKT